VWDPSGDVCSSWRARASCSSICNPRAAMWKPSAGADAAGLSGRASSSRKDPRPLTGRQPGRRRAGVGEAAAPEAEALRCFSQGQGVSSQRELTKPFPAGDDWIILSCPTTTLFPRSSGAGALLTSFWRPRMHLAQVAVAAADGLQGFRHIAFKAREEPWLNTLAAFNGYNGTLLWKRPIARSHGPSNTLSPTHVVYFGTTNPARSSTRHGQLVDEVARRGRRGWNVWKWMV